MLLIYLLENVTKCYKHQQQHMPPKKVQPKQEPKKEAPKVEQKKQPDKNAKNVKQQPKKDGKGSIEKVTKDPKAIEKQQPKGNDKKQEKKDDKKAGDKKQNPKDAKPQEKDNKKDSKAPDKKDAKAQKQVVKDQQGAKKQENKKDPNSKSLAKLQKGKQEEKPKKDGKEQAVVKDAKGKQIPNKHVQQRKAVTPKGRDKIEKDRSPSKAIINKMDEPQQPIERVKGDDYLIKQTGLLQAYEQFLRTICKYGLPTGDIYQFAAQQIQKYERKKKAKELKLKAEMQIRKAASRRPLKQQGKPEEYDL